jgi:hypothetical protein
MRKIFIISCFVAYVSVSSSCGLKLSPKSEIKDFRPAIVFHPESSESESESEIKKTGKNPKDEAKTDEK